MDRGAQDREPLLRQDPAHEGGGGDDPLAVRLHAGAEQGRAPPGRRAADRAQEGRRRSAPASWARASPTCRPAPASRWCCIDRDQEAADKGKAHSTSSSADQIMSAAAPRPRRSDALLARITPTADYADLKGVDLVIEAVFEDREVKAEVIAKAEAVLGQDAIFGSNTSTLADHRRSPSTPQRPKNFIGIHFFSPVEKMMLVEIIIGKKTGDAGARHGARLRARRSRRRRSSSTTRAASTPTAASAPIIREGHLMLMRGRAAGDDRERRQHGRHAGRPARRSTTRSAIDLASRSCRRPKDAGRPEGASTRSQEKLIDDHGRAPRPLRPQEQEGLLRLSRAAARSGCGRGSPTLPRRSSIPTRSTWRS